MNILGQIYHARRVSRQKLEYPHGKVVAKQANTVNQSEPVPGTDRGFQYSPFRLCRRILCNERARVGELYVVVT